MLATILSAGGLLLVVAYCVENALVLREQARLASELSDLDRAHEADIAVSEVAEQQSAATEEAAHRRRLADERLVSGAAAHERQAQEWQRRLAHDPSLAASMLETNLLRMERLGRDPSLTAKLALQEVARLASPPGARVEVSSLGDRFVVRMAFKMSEVSAHEKGAVTKHTSLAPCGVRSKNCQLVVLKSCLTTAVREALSVCARRSAASMARSAPRQPIGMIGRG